ncbi:MAG: hypothetical protein M1820_007919 [Bogoriella megaspora]|nr:MAG: hypothetical protein M1820_007919 [Bogoriella megaspora]
MSSLEHLRAEASKRCDLRARSRNAFPCDEEQMFEETKTIGLELQRQTGAFGLIPLQPFSSLNVLDLCAAPGGFTAAILETHPDAKVTALTYGSSVGAHAMLRPRLRPEANNMVIEDLERTGLIGKIRAGATSTVDKATLFLREFQHIVLCNGQIRHHSYMEAPLTMALNFELYRLELGIALSSIAIGGTIVMLLESPEHEATAQLLEIFSKFSDVTLFKHDSIHAVDSTFYVVAKNVQPYSPGAAEARIYCARLSSTEQTGQFYCNTFSDITRPITVTDDHVSCPRNRFPRLNLGRSTLYHTAGGAIRPIWQIQMRALSSAIAEPTIAE